MYSFVLQHSETRHIDGGKSVCNNFLHNGSIRLGLEEQAVVRVGFKTLRDSFFSFF